MYNFKIVEIPSEPKSEQCAKSFDIASSSRKTCYDLFTLFSKERGGKKGATKDQEQDLLRSMLIFASAGFDATLKQLTRECLESVINSNRGAQLQFEIYTERYLKQRVANESGNIGIVNTKNLASIISAKSPRSILISNLIEELTSDSLQSSDAMLKVLSYFALGIHDININPSKLKNIFRIRNEIIHEMDILFDQKNRSRRSRKGKEMTEHTNFLLTLSFDLIKKIDSVLQSA